MASPILAGDPAPLPSDESEAVHLVSISQATAATFADLFIGQTMLCFVRAGTKRIAVPGGEDIIAAEGDLIVFPAGMLVTLENRPRRDADYRADGVTFSDALVAAMFADQPLARGAASVAIVRAIPHRPAAILALLRETLADPRLPPAIRAHRLREPLQWLRELGVRLPAGGDSPLIRLRRLIERDPARPWRAAEVARHFAMSEATLRRRLARAGCPFARVLHTMRLEQGLARLQTTPAPIAEIALECGFATPSHFSDSFKKRFGITPRQVRTAEE